MLKQKKVPMRMCTGCREMKPKKELQRIVKSPEGVISVDRVGRMPGRGAYVCKSVECLKKAQKTRALERALETQIAPDVFETLLADFSKEEADA